MHTLNISLFGGMPGTLNLGVSALCFSTIAGILKRQTNTNITVFGFENNISKKEFKTDEQTFKYTSAGAVYSRRFYRRNNLWNIWLSGFLGGLGNPVIQIISKSQAVLDISGGDSFTDLYGLKRFNYITLPKLITLQQKRPLILLPQTYGPFATSHSRRVAEKIVRKASAVWARDEISFNNLKRLLGGAYDPIRHHSGVDVAFALPMIKPKKELSNGVITWLSQNREQVTVGINVSGLIFNNPNAAVNRYKFRADYRKIIIEFLRLLLQKTDVNILLIPHVLAPIGSYESDPEANNKVARELANVSGSRLKIISSDFDQSEIKWIISHCDWFCGTRMHSTIAGLSTGVPTTAIAYSIKTQGVFETCGQGDHVIDPRYLSTDDAIDALFTSFQQYKKTKIDLSHHLPFIKQRVELQMDQIVITCLKAETDI